MLASLVAAFTSTVETHLNWNASYFVTDVYRRFLRPEATEKQCVRVSRLAVVGYAALAIVIAYFMAVRAVLEGVVSPSFVDLVERIRSGAFDYVLLKPVDVLWVDLVTVAEAEARAGGVLEELRRGRTHRHARA